MTLTLSFLGISSSKGQILGAWDGSGYNRRTDLGTFKRDRSWDAAGHESF